jgi:hypothetical protein
MAASRNAEGQFFVRDTEGLVLATKQDQKPQSSSWALQQLGFGFVVSVQYSTVQRQHRSLHGQTNDTIRNFRNGVLVHLN